MQGRRPSGGHAVRIERIEDRNKDLLVSVVETRPAPRLPGGRRVDQPVPRRPPASQRAAGPFRAPDGRACLRVRTDCAASVALQHGVGNAAVTRSLLRDSAGLGGGDRRRVARDFGFGEPVTHGQAMLYLWGRPPGDSAVIRPDPKARTKAARYPLPPATRRRGQPGRAPATGSARAVPVRRDATTGGSRHLGWQCLSSRPPPRSPTRMISSSVHGCSTAGLPRVDRKWFPAPAVGHVR